ncbi:MAG: hypothetical protein ACI4C3_01100 [Bacteroides sp.]
MADLKILKINGVDYNVGFSTNDFDDAAKTKLQGIAEGAQANVLEGVQVDGSDLQIDDQKKVNVDLATPIATAKSEAIEAGKLTMEESAGTGNILKVYTFKQNGAVVATINTPKDLVTTGGSIVEVEGVKYLRLTIANQEAPVDIPVTDLVDVYTGSAYIEVSASNEISIKFDDLDAALAGESSQVGAAIKAAKTQADKGVADAAAAKASADAAQATADGAKATADANKTKLDGISDGANKTTVSYDADMFTLAMTIA